LEKLPLEQWTHETHGEIVALLRKSKDEKTIDLNQLLENLSPDAAGIVSDVMLSEDGDAPPELRVIDDWIARVHTHWARQAEREWLEAIRLKLDRGEPVNPDEKEALKNALIGTKRTAGGRPAGQLDPKKDFDERTH
jgi:hypothetical protein